MTELGVIALFNKTFELRNCPAGLTFHSDRGSQYTSFMFRSHLRKLGVTLSYSHPGMPLDNAVAESFFACMKREELSHNYYNSIENLEQTVSEYVSFYNEQRPHYKLGNKTPVQCENEFFKNIWKNGISGHCLTESVQYTVTVSIGGGGGSRTRVPTRIDEDIYMLVPSSLVFRPPFRQWTGDPSEQAFFNLAQTPNAGSPGQSAGWRRLYLSTRSGTATWRDYAARANSSFAFIVLTGD